MGYASERMADEDRLVGNRYRIVREIAAGGMGTVYEAQHALSKKTVALKVLHPQYARDEAAKQRFLREVAAPARIGHDGICEVYDAGHDEADNSLFVAMEMLNGQTLREAWDAGTLTPDQKLDQFEELLEALAAAHDKGIVHRDMKPENVFVHTTRGGKRMIKLLDFGIVREPEETNVTQAGMGMGTPDYMSPEQATSAKDVTAASDVWSCGVMLYEALAGQLPFHGKTPSAVVVDVITRPHTPLRSAVHNIPPPLSDLVDRCLSKEPEHRPQDAGQLLGFLRAARGAVQALPKTMATPAFPGPAAVTPNPGAPFGVGAPTPQPNSTGPAGPGYAPAPGSTPSPYGATAAPGTAPGPFGASPTPAPTPGPFGPPGTNHGVPSPSANYGTPPPGSSPGFTGSGYGAPVPTPTPGTYGAVTPPTPSPGGKASAGSGIAIWALIGCGVLLLAGFVTVVILLIVDGGGSGGDTLAGGDGQIQVTTNVQGAELVIDGANQGAVQNGQTYSIAGGTHTVELFVSNASVASQMITVLDNQITQVVLQPAELRFTGLLELGDPVRPDGKYADTYTFQWTQGAANIFLESDPLDMFLYVQLPNGTVQENDDTNGTNSYLHIPVTQPGTYTVTATTYQAGQVGPYSLRIQGP
ncbi:MAG: protein kinase [Myxococcota bacterium]